MLSYVELYNKNTGLACIFIAEKKICLFF